jgi:hypothetical protein
LSLAKRSKQAGSHLEHPFLFIRARLSQTHRRATTASSLARTRSFPAMARDSVRRDSKPGSINPQTKSLAWRKRLATPRPKSSPSHTAIRCEHFCFAKIQFTRKAPLGGRQPAELNRQTFGPVPSPESNWLSSTKCRPCPNRQHAGPPSRFLIFRTIGKGLEHPWNKTLSLCGDFQQLPGVKAIESSGFMERAMGIESTSEVWESTNPFVGRSAAFMRPRCRRGSSEKARSRWQFRCIAAPRNQLFES